MHVTQYARRSVASAALALAVAGCTKDTGPSEFSAQGTSADVAAAENAFGSRQASSFAAVGIQISTVLNGSPVVANSAALALHKPSAASARLVRQLAPLVPSAIRPAGIRASMAGIPAEAMGTTFVWDAETDAYVASDVGGAPATGVRFQLYAVDPVQLVPVEPVVQVGYVDIVDQSTAATTDLRVKVVEGSVVYLDYDVTGTATATGGLVTISGFATNGTAYANFDLKNTLSANSIVFDYDLAVPSRGVTLNWSATFANVSATEVAVTLDLAISGRNGDVRILGTYGAAGGSFTVSVNGDPFAIVTLEGSDPVITSASGTPLTVQEEATLQTILGYYETSLNAFADLVTPLS